MRMNEAVFLIDHIIKSTMKSLKHNKKWYKKEQNGMVNQRTSPRKLHANAQCSVHEKKSLAVDRKE